MLKQISLVSCLGLVAACGGSGGGGGSMTMNPPTAAQYTPLTNRMSVQSDVVGVAYVDSLGRISTAPNIFDTQDEQYITVSGTFDHATGTARLSRDGTVVTATADSQALQGRDLGLYRYSGVSNQFLVRDPADPDNNDIAQSSQVVFGIPTRDADMPTTTTALYQGDAVITYQTDDSFSGIRSDAIVSANFAAGRVTVAIVPESTQDDDPFDRFERRNMIIDGSSFRGGFARFTLDGKAVNPTGTTQSSFARGEFFGPVDAEPAEVGGMIRVTGSDAEVTATFIAR
ncbi:transferrin-binding protein-like solute binding protein [Yoonia sp. 208BN28-4]|uniref:transferrin-binding protein-like solute binding protein n=1 Tax=Yoonia sp. 208BN28-4 TaxID=3126505 RepID=UPI00309F8224